MSTSSEVLDDLPILFFAGSAPWRLWLTKHHGQQTGVWLKLAKKTSGITSVSYAKALDEALCFGWIDGLSKSYNEQYYLQKFTPRRARSLWSKINVEKANALIDTGRMQPPGLAEIERAKQDGRWERAYEPSTTITMPEDFQQALSAHPKAAAFYETLTKANRYSFLWRIHTAKKPETRRIRIEKSIAMLLSKQTYH